MLEYRFEHKEPLTWRVTLAVRVDAKRKKEQIWVGTELEVERALHGREDAACLALTRPLGAFWCEVGQTPAEGWNEAFGALCRALAARRLAERKKQEADAAIVLSQLVEENRTNAAAWYAAIQIWEMYLRCCRGRDRQKALAAFRQFAELVILPFGEYTPEMLQWRREKPITLVWNDRADAKLEIWYPQGKIPFECAVTDGSLRPALIYYRQRILDAGLLMRQCSHCGKIFFANDTRSCLCGERCRKASKKAARQGFEDRNKGLDCEQAYAREYMFWYNRITKLKKNSAPAEQIGRAKAALKQFSSEALKQKQLVKQGKMADAKFVAWMLAQEKTILEICEES